jgi:hypothetical protein
MKSKLTSDSRIAVLATHLRMQAGGSAIVRDPSVAWPHVARYPQSARHRRVPSLSWCDATASI